MSENTQDLVEVYVLYEAVKKRVKFFITPTNKLDELKAQLDRYFIHIGTNQRASDVVVNVAGVDLGEDNEEDFWNTMYFPQLVENDNDIAYMISVMVENNILQLYV